MENNDSKPPKKSRQRKRQVKRTPSVAVNMRVPADVWEKLEWEAIARGVARPDFIRSTLSDAVKNSRPPAADDTAVISGVVGRRKEAWLALAKEYGCSIGEVAAKLMDLQTKKKFGTAPVFRNGEWHWPVGEGEENA